MDLTYNVYSTYYLEQDVSPYNCYVNEKEWSRLNNELTSNRIIGVIQKNNKTWVVTLGQPVHSEIQHNKAIFIPRWMLEQIYIEGYGETIEVQWMPCDAFDNSEHIQLKLLNGSYTNDDIEEKLSIELTKLGVLQKDTIIKIQIHDTLLTYEVKNLIPATIVLCEGDSVSLEFVEDLPNLIMPSGRPPSPYPMNPDLLFEPPQPSAPPPDDTYGRTVGGVKRDEHFNPWRSKDFKPPNS